MRRFTRPEWDGRKTLVVRRSFKGAGRTFHPYDPFEWKRLGVEPRRVRQLYDAGFLDHAEAPAFTMQPGSVTPRVTESAPAPVDNPPPVGAPSEPGADTAEPEDDSSEFDALMELKMPELREIAHNEGAATRLAKSDQVRAILAHRSETDNGARDA